MSCGECRKVYPILKGTDPPCEQCRPKINENNIDAWEVFNLASGDPRGINPQGIIAVAQVSQVYDPYETLLKVTELTDEIRSMTAGPKGPREENG